MRERVYRVLFGFCGIGGAALGFQRALVEMLGTRARFEIVGGIDIDKEACANFEMLTKAPALCADIRTLTPSQLRAFVGGTRPDVSICSAPCQGGSALISNEQAETEHYREMNRLALIWTRQLLSTWDEPIPLLLNENVPRLTSRAPVMLEDLHRLLTSAGYVMHDGYHDCGELGGLAQHRRRWLRIARHSRSVPALIYQPPKKRVRGVGEVLEHLPMPGEIAGGPMHALPKLAWKNWVRLALTPAGGDWRDLNGVLDAHQPRREKFRRNHVSKWDNPSVTIAGPGSNGPYGVADPRLSHLLRVERAFDAGYRLVKWDQPTSTIAGGSYPGQGAYSVADIRIDCAPRAGAYGVIGWAQASRTITASACLDNGAFSVADPRKQIAPPNCPVIVSAEGTWNRPFTMLDLAALQDLPTTVDGKPLDLIGKSKTSKRKHIGNLIPPGAAEAIALKVLVGLVSAEAGSFLLSADPIWVSPDGEERPMELVQ